MKTQKDKTLLRKGWTIFWTIWALAIPFISWLLMKEKIHWGFIIWGAITLFGLIIIFMVIIEDFFNKKIEQKVKEILKKEGLIKNGK